MSLKDLDHAGTAPLALVERALSGIARTFRHATRRRRLSRLRDLDDHMLDDIGVTRAEIEIATKLPFSRDPAEELRRLSLQRRREREAILASRL